ncbi:MAG: LamG domain-containing protein [Deltaproteobacteria bacterium]|nr:LamG domain-containing protein [Deltaproteobacteria bacterium]
MHADGAALRLLPLLFAFSLTTGACSIDQGALLPADAGDGALPDTGTVPDTGPRPPDSSVPPLGPCADFGEPHVVAVVSGDALFDGASHDGTEREAPGNIALRGNSYRYGTWAVAGHEDAHLGNPPSLSDLEGRVATAAAYRDDFDVSYDDSEPPHDLLIAGDGVYTVEIHGELRLATGTNTLHATVEDRLILEVDVDGTTHTLSRGTSGSGDVSIDAPRDGWYRVRGAWQSDGGDGELTLEITPRTGGRRELWTEEMRVDSNAFRSREVHGWDSIDFDGEPSGSRIERSETDWSSSGGDEYPGVGIEDHDTWAVRWVGRHLIPDPIDAFHFAANQGASLFVDGVFLGSGADRTLDSAAPDGTVDVVAELWDGNADSEMLLEFNSAPFPIDHLRPASRFGGVPHGRGDEFTVFVSGGFTQSVDVDLGAIPSGRTSAVEVSVIIETADPGPINVTVTEPGGLTETRRLVDAAWSRQAGQWHLRSVPDWADTLTDASGTWEVTVDNTGTDVVVWHHVGVLAHLGGTPEPFPRSGIFRTAFIDLGDETLIRGVRGGGIVTGRSWVQFGIRAGNTPIDVPFAPTDAAGDLPTAIRGRYVQIEVSLSGPGWDTPRVRDLRILGDACRRCTETDPLTCPEERSSEGLVAMWMFDEGEGGMVRDVSGFQTHDLITPTEAGWSWTTDHLAFESGAPVLTIDRPIDAIREAFVTSGEFTIEAWVRPDNRTQGGPARILTMEEETNARNVTLSQQAETYEGRIRRVGNNSGAPYVTSAPGSAQTSLQHVVLTRRADGVAQLWVDGVASGDQGDTAGDLSNWDAVYRLYVGNARTADRPWLGDFHLVAMYSRALSQAAVERHYRIGPRRVAGP